MRFELGRTQGTVAECDLSVLIDTRLLVQANSGGGKSWLLRRILEQTHGHVQQLIVDPEGEFATLRERGDYVLAAKQGGDTAAEPRSAKLLAERLLELSVSAILDVYELKAHERVRFVRQFLEALVDAPKRLWHPALVVVDEAHVYCPQKGEAESAGAVIDLATRGRKRGFCAVIATQRLSKLHKDAAAECNNKLIGRSALDVDMKRAAEELGFSGREEQHQLRNLEPGEFFAFGPAVSRVVRKVMVGPVQTTHPKAGARLAFTPPPPTERIRELLPRLEDLPAEAEERQRTIEGLQRELTQARRELSAAKRGVAVDETVVQRRVEQALAEQRCQHETELDIMRDRLDRVRADLRDGAALIERGREGLAAPPDSPRARPQPSRPARKAPAVVSAPLRDDPPPSTDGLKAGARRILQELASRHPLTLTKAQLGTLTGFAPSGGTFGTYVGELRRRGLLEISGKEVRVTDDGLHAVDEIPPAPSTHAEIMAMWRRNLKAGCYRLLETVVDAGSEGISRQVLAEETGYEMSGGTFGTYVGILRRNELVKDEGGLLRASDVLWP